MVVSDLSARPSDQRACALDACRRAQQDRPAGLRRHAGDVGVKKPDAIILAREALLPALGLVSKAVERRSTIPVLANVLLAVDAAAGTLTITGSDLDCELRAKLSCQAGKDEAFTLPSAILHDAVRKMPDGAEIAL
ncbi:MAG: hypothetical protein E5X60_38335, partial [Mesorhizobium sp.]